MDKIKDLFLINSLFRSMDVFSSPEYNNLTDEEKEDMKFVDCCLFGDNEKISDSSTKIMFLILDYSASLEDKPMSDEEFILKRDTILNDLSEDEQEIIIQFTSSLINTIGIYSEERVEERKQKRKKPNE